MGPRGVWIEHGKLPLLVKLAFGCLLVFAALQALNTIPDLHPEIL
jgi:hypothetical protein